MDVFEKQRLEWNHLASRIGSPQELPRDWVMALNVEDPRLNRPAKKTIPSSDVSNGQNDRRVISYDALLAQSDLWRPEVRREVKEKKLSIADIHILRRAVLIPGSQLKIGKYTAHLPIICCQHPGGGGGGAAAADECWGSGVEVLLPESWGKDFWLSLVYNGARAGGLQEVAAADFENGNLSFPRSRPDSVEGARMAEVAEEEAIRKYFAKPIAKRVNHLRLGARFPFRSPWATLVEDWKDWEDWTGGGGGEGCDSELKERAAEDCGNGAMRITKQSNKDGIFAVVRDRVLLGHVKELISSDYSSSSSPLPSHLSLSNYLIPVRVTADQKGVILPFSLLCAPTSQDVEDYSKSLVRRKNVVSSSWIPPEEPLHFVSEQHRRHLKMAVKKSGQGLGAGRFPISASDPESVADVCSRLTMGFVVEGKLSLRLGKPRGIGFVAFNAIEYLISVFRRDEVDETNNNNNNNNNNAKRKRIANSRELFLLCRCPNSQQYRKVELEILH